MNIPSLLWQAFVIYTICFCLHRLLQCVGWSWSHTDVRKLTTSSASFFVCVEDKIQGDLQIGDMGRRQLSGLAAHGGVCGFGMVCPSSHIQPFPLKSSDSQPGYSCLWGFSCSCHEVYHDKIGSSSTNLTEISIYL